MIDIPTGTVRTYVYDRQHQELKQELHNDLINKLLTDLKSQRECVGNNDDKFKDLQIASKASYTTTIPYFSIRHNDCTLLLTDEKGERCKVCSTFRGALRKKVSNNAAPKTQASCDATSKTSLSKLSYNPLLQRARNMAARTVSDNQEIKQLKLRVEKALRENQVSVNTKVDALMRQTLAQQVANGTENLPPLKKLFIQEQLKVAGCKSQKGMRWHPTMIRWCLSLRHKSRSAYQYIRETGANLPCNSTLDDYAHYRQIGAGVDVEGLANLAREHGGKSVAILCDEMKVKDGLVYDINTGNLVGYTDIDIETGLDKPDNHSIATHALVFMVRGITSNFKLAAATYATTTATAEQIYMKFWELVGAVELLGMKARVFIGDGAATNRKFINIHHADFPNDQVTFRAINKYATDRTIYFVSCAPHLIKTTRNNWENSGWNKNSRNLIVSRPN